MGVQSKNSRILTTTEVSYLLHVHPNSVRQWANKGLFFAYRLGTGGDRGFKREEVENFIRSTGQKSWQPKGYLNRVSALSKYREIQGVFLG